MGKPAAAARVSAYTVAWIVWVLFFFLVEGLALFSKTPGATFSEHWWSLFRVRSKVPLPLKIVLMVVQLAAGVWLVAHLTFGIWPSA